MPLNNNGGGGIKSNCVIYNRYQSQGVSIAKDQMSGKGVLSVGTSAYGRQDIGSPVCPFRSTPGFLEYILEYISFVIVGQQPIVLVTKHFHLRNPMQINEF